MSDLAELHQAEIADAIWDLVADLGFADARGSAQYEHVFRDGHGDEQRAVFMAAFRRFSAVLDRKGLW